MSRRGRKQFDKEGRTYFITTTVENFDRFLTIADKYSNIIIDSLKFLINKQMVSLFGYVIMPSHIHLLLYIPKHKSISDFMRDFKKFTSFKIYNNFILDKKEDLICKLKENNSTGKWKLWMDRFDAIIVDSENFFNQKLNYIHENPVRAGLVKEITDWKYSSARNYLLCDNSIIEVCTDFVPLKM